MTDLNRKMAAGAAWMILMRLATRALGFISTVILARLLAPGDFGLVALATAVTAALELMTAFSFDIALIQEQEHSRSDYDTAWTITILFSIATAAILTVLAHPAALFYAEPRFEPIMYVLAVGTVVEGGQNIGVVAFRKDMHFGKEFAFQIGRKVVAFAITVPLAFWLRNYWALVAGILAGKIASTGLSYLAHPYRPRLSTAAWRKLFGFSRWLFLNNLLGFLRYRAADFIVGKIAGPTALGLFSVSFELSQLPTSELVAPINRSVFPAYAQIACDLRRLQQSYLDVVAMIAFLAIPAAVGIALLADEVTAVVLGQQWLAAVPLIRILGLAGVISTLETNIGAAYLALGQPKIITQLFAFYATLLIALLVFFTQQWGVTGAAWASLLAALINIPIYFGMMLRTLALPLGRLLGVLWRPLIASSAMCAVVWLWLEAAPDLGALALLFSSTAIGALAYFLAIFALWQLAGRPSSAETVVWRRVRLSIGEIRSYIAR